MNFTLALMQEQYQDADCERKSAVGGTGGCAYRDSGGLPQLDWAEIAVSVLKFSYLNVWIVVQSALILTANSRFWGACAVRHA
jgi:hypothetical protein